MSKLERISEAHDRRIIWRETGDIVHFDLAGKLLHREKYSKKSLSKILTFFDRQLNANTQLIAQFNVASKLLMSHINGVDILEKTDYRISTKINNDKSCRNKIKRHMYNNSEITQMYVRNDDGFEPNMRYNIVVDGDLVNFEVFEKLASDNLNTQYDDEVLSIYVMDK